MYDNFLDITSGWSFIMLSWALILMVRRIKDATDLAVVGLIGSYTLLLGLIAVRRWLNLPVEVVLPGFAVSAVASTFIAVYVTKVVNNNDTRSE